MKVDIYRLGESDDSWAVLVEGSVIEDLTGLSREQAEHHAGLIAASWAPGSGAVELPAGEQGGKQDQGSGTRWVDSGSGPGWEVGPEDRGTAWERHDDPEQNR